MKHIGENKFLKNHIYLAATVFALLIWSTSFIGTKLAYASFPPITLGALRFIIASFILMIILLIKREFIRPPLKDMLTISASGILGITLYFTMQNIGVNLTTASNAALIVASYPAITTLLELIIYKIRISRFKISGIFLAMVGIYLLSYVAATKNNQTQYLGNIILIATGVVWAFYNFTTRKVVNKYPAITVSFFQTITGTIFFIPLTLIERVDWQMPTVESVTILVYLGVMCSVVAFILYNFGLRKISASTSVSLTNLVPVFGVIFSILFLHESVSLRQIIGGLIVISGVLLSLKKDKKNHGVLKNNLSQ